MKFNKPHPALEGFREPHKSMMWLVDAFFRLHRRRQLGESGFQPISITEASDFASHVLTLQDGLKRLYFRAIEEADNAVLYDHYAKVKESAEQMKAEAAAAPRHPPRKPRR